MPLPDKSWERGKCGYKLIQFMACARPVVASPVGVNCQIVDPAVNGFLASAPAEWEQALRTLRDNAALRRQMGRMARQKVEQEYCLQVTAPRMLALFHEVLTNRGNAHSQDRPAGRGDTFMSERIAVLGLGYVGLPVALAFARQFPGTLGFDINSERVCQLRSGYDRSGEVRGRGAEISSLVFTDDPAELADATFFVVAVPTPIDRNNRPDLRPLITASGNARQGHASGQRRRLRVHRLSRRDGRHLRRGSGESCRA